MYNRSMDISILKVPLEKATYVRILLGYLVGFPLFCIAVVFIPAPVYRLIGNAGFGIFFVTVIFFAVVFLYLTVRNRLETLGRSKLGALLLLVPVVSLVLIIYLIYAKPKLG